MNRNTATKPDRLNQSTGNNSEAAPAPDAGTAAPPPVFPRLPGETPRAYGAFKAYFELGPSRSLPVVAEKLSESPGTVKNWSSKFDWAERIQAFNAGLLQLHADARLREAAEWSRRLEDLREQEWDSAQKLRSAARCFLDSYGDDELRRMTLSQVSRALTISSHIARAAVIGAEVPVPPDPEGSLLQQQLLDAVKRLYGKPGPPASAPPTSSSPSLPSAAPAPADN